MNYDEIVARINDYTRHEFTIERAEDEPADEYFWLVKILFEDGRVYYDYVDLLRTTDIETAIQYAAQQLLHHWEERDMKEVFERAYSSLSEDEKSCVIKLDREGVVGFETLNPVASNEIKIYQGLTFLVMCEQHDLGYAIVFRVTEATRIMAALIREKANGK